MTKDEALKLALEALKQIDEAMPFPVAKLAQKVIKEALAQPEPCGGCKGSGWVTRDPDIGTDQECFVCGGSGAYPKEPEQKPVAWLLTDKNINSLQVDSIQRLIDRLKHAHHTDLCVRINGQDEWFQADWLKHMVRASPPQRTWVGLTDEEVINVMPNDDTPMSLGEAFSKFAELIEAKLKEKNVPKD